MDAILDLANKIGNRTDRRIDALKDARARRVTYRAKSAQW